MNSEDKSEKAIRLSPGFLGTFALRETSHHVKSPETTLQGIPHVEDQVDSPTYA